MQIINVVYKSLYHLVSGLNVFKALERNCVLNSRVVSVKCDNVVNAHIVAELLKSYCTVEGLSWWTLVLSALIKHGHNNGYSVSFAAYCGNRSFKVGKMLVRTHGNCLTVHIVGHAVVEHIAYNKNIVTANGLVKRAFAFARAESREWGINDISISFISCKGKAVFVLRLLLSAPFDEITVDFLG